MTSYIPKKIVKFVLISWDEVDWQDETQNLAIILCYMLYISETNSGQYDPGRHTVLVFAAIQKFQRVENFFFDWTLTYTTM